MKILILRFSAIGDIVLTTPVMRCLKQQMPDVEIHYATRAQHTALLKANPYVDKVWEWQHPDKGQWKQLMHNLAQENFDHVLDLHNNLRTRRLTRALGAVPCTRFPKLNIEKWLYVNLKWNRMPKVHIVDRYLQTTQSWGITNDQQGLDYFYPADFTKPTIPSAYLQEEALKPALAMVIGATHFTKQLPVGRVVELCEGAWQQFKHIPVLLGGPTDVARAATIAHALHDKGIPCWNTVGQLTLAQSAWVVQHSTWVATNDTGLMHIAAAFKKKIVSLWGNTTPDLGMYPYQTQHLVWQHEKGLSCRPCSKIGYSACPKGHFKCMNLIPFQWHEVRQLLQS